MSSLLTGEIATRHSTTISMGPGDDTFRNHFGDINIGREASVHLGDNVGVHHHYYETAKLPQNSSFDKGKYDMLLNSLTFERMDARLRNITTALPQTCTWIFHHKKFTAWNDESQRPQHNGFLWIKGKPGCGKSTIMKTTLNWTRRNWPEHWIIMSYFFNARAPSALEKSSLGLYRSVTYRLLSALSGFEQSFLETFSSKICSDSIEEWSISELQEYLVEIAQSKQRPPVCLFVDALDEGEDDDIRSMIDFLEEISSDATSSNQAFRICLSSRHYPNITITHALHLIVEDEPDHDHDIEVYVDKKLRAATRQGIGDLRRRLIRKSGRIFLWVVLVIPMLNKAYDRGGGLNAMSTLLTEMPKGLGALFSDISSKRNECFEEFEILLRWVLYSKRTLSPRELYLAVLYTKYANFNEDFQEAEEAVADASRVQRCILDWSRGLVEMTKPEEDYLGAESNDSKNNEGSEDSENSTIQFIHETVRHYMTSSKEASLMVPTLSSDAQGPSHEVMRAACARYVERKQLWRARAEDSGEALRKGNPFAYYSAHGMFYHANRAQQHHVSQRSFLLSQMDRQSGLIKAETFHSYLLLKSAEFTPRITPLIYFVTEHNFRYLAEVLVKESVDIHARDPQSGKTPLEIACKEGFLEIARCLIEHSADGAVHRTWKEDALQAACQSINGPLEIVRLLLDRGADVNTRGGECGNVLHTALNERNFEIANLLLKYGADFSLHGGVKWRGKSALYLAAVFGAQKTVELLLSKGADVNEQEERLDGETVLLAVVRRYRASRWLYRYVRFRGPRPEEGLKVIELLLDGGADVNAQGGYYGNALQAACRHGQHELVKLLLDRGADINARGGQFGNALCAACRSVAPEVVELLLDQGVNVNAKVERDGNALQVACAQGHIAIAKLLLDRGADVNAHAGYFGNALYAAAFFGHLNVMTLLLDREADINARGVNNGTALIAAAGSYHPSAVCEDIVGFLTERGADVKARDSYGATALCWAAFNGFSQYVQMLLDAGAGDLPDGTCDEEEVRRALKSAEEGFVSSEKERFVSTVELLEQKIGCHSTVQLPELKVPLKHERIGTANSDSAESKTVTNSPM